MNSIDLWLQFKEVFIDLVKYGFPTIAIIISILSFIDSRKAKRIQSRLSSLEEKIKKYELEEMEIERENATKACIQARIIKISQGSYKMKVWNSGKATAYNVDFRIPQEYANTIWRDKVPFEFLEPNKSFEEIVIVTGGTPNKIMITTIWNDEKGSTHTKEQMVDI